MNEDTVHVLVKRDLAEKMTKPWYLVKAWEASEVREAFQTALNVEDFFTELETDG